METADDVLELMDTSAEGVIALVRDAGATFLAPIYHELAGVVCTGGTPRSHIGIVSREFQVPCIMAATFAGGEPADGDEVELDCSGDVGVLWGAAAMDDDARRAWVNERIAYIGPIAKQLTEERTSLESKIIPVSAYIVTACIESFLRYPEMMRIIDAAMPAEQIGVAARRPGCRVNTVYLWSVVNFWLIGRKVWSMIDPVLADNLDNAHTVVDFWERAAKGFRGDGTRHAADNAIAAPYRGDVRAQLMSAITPVDDPALRAAIRSFNATLVAYLFLLYFDTRVGHGDTGPYELSAGRTLIVRDFYSMAESDFAWSDVARDVPYRNLTAAMVLEGVTVDRVTDFGTSYTTPEDFLDHLVGFGLYTTDDMPLGQLRPVPLDEMAGIVAAVRKAQSAHYRNIAAMSRDDKIRHGAYVYFSFLRPFAIEAGVEDQIDWTVPRDIPPPIYDMVSVMEGDNAGPPDDDAPYYAGL